MIVNKPLVPEDVVKATEFRVEGRTSSGGYSIRQDLNHQHLRGVDLLNYAVEGFEQVDRVQWRGYYWPVNGPREGVPTLTEWQDLRRFIL